MITYKELSSGSIAVYLERRRVGQIVKITNVTTGFTYWQYRAYNGSTGAMFSSIQDVKASLEAE